MLGNNANDAFHQLWNCSGFPEPYLKGTTRYYKRWRTSHLDIILKNDLRDLSTIHDLSSIENLILLVRNRVGSSISYSNNALKKECDFLHDTQGICCNLHYLRTKDGKEIDFLITQDNQPSHMIELKTIDHEPHSAFKHFEKFLPNTKKLQLVHQLKRESTLANGLEVRTLIPWLANFTLKLS